MSISLMVLMWACAGVYSLALFALFQGKITLEVLVQAVTISPISAFVWTVLVLAEASEGVVIWRRKE